MRFGVIVDYMRNLFVILAGLLLNLQLVACGTDSGSGEQGDSGTQASTQSTPVSITQTGSTGKTSSISLRLTDAPIDDLVRAVVTFTAVELKRQAGDGWIKFTLKKPESIDLMALQGGNTADLLANVTADADDYKELRLYTSGDSGDNFVELATGGTRPLQIPGGSSSGLKIKQNFTITEMQAASFVVDFDLRQSIRSPGKSGKYMLKPVMRMVSVNGVGNIQGYVDPLLLTSPSCSDALVDTYNAAYIYAGHDADTDDINQQSASTNNPVATAAVEYDASSDKYLYNVAFLAAGEYTVAVTCSADLEDLDANDNLPFIFIQNTTVLANDTVYL